MLLILFILISFGLALWLRSEGLSFLGSAILFLVFSIFIWLIVISFFSIFLPTIDVQTELIIDGYDYDSSFPNDYLCYIVDGEIFQVSGDITIFEGGAKDSLVIVEKFIDTPDWFWLISFLDHHRVPWSTDYYIR